MYAFRLEIKQKQLLLPNHVMITVDLLMLICPPQTQEQQRNTEQRQISLKPTPTADRGRCVTHTRLCVVMVYFALTVV